MADHGLLRPGDGPDADDDALVRAMLAVEVAWAGALADVGAVTPAQAEAVAAVVDDWMPDVTALARESEGAGNPVAALVAGLRQEVRTRVDAAATAAVHRGLTSQDVLDTAFVLLDRTALTAVVADLDRVATALGRLAGEHRDSVMAGRTLTQHAVPITFGLKAARWLEGVLDARARAADELTRLPVQCGGAAGTHALATELTAGRAVEAAHHLARRLDLRWSAPWHTRRTPVTAVGDALVTVCDTLAVIGGDVALLARPEIRELSEPAAPGRGGSSTMPQKRNPVLSVLLRAAGLQAPQLGAQLHLAAALTGDERPDGAWHAEWPAHRRLLQLAVGSAARAAELVEGLGVHAEAMRRTAEAGAGQLTAESGTAGGGATGDVSAYLGVCGELVDRALTRLTEEVPGHG